MRLQYVRIWSDALDESTSWPLNNFSTQLCNCKIIAKFFSRLSFSWIWFQVLFPITKIEWRYSWREVLNHTWTWYRSIWYFWLNNNSILYLLEKWMRLAWNVPLLQWWNELSVRIIEKPLEMFLAYYFHLSRQEQNDYFRFGVLFVTSSHHKQFCSITHDQ